MRTTLGDVVIRIAATAVRLTVGRIMARQKAMPEVSLPVAGHKLNDELRALGIRTLWNMREEDCDVIVASQLAQRRWCGLQRANKQVITMKRLSRHCL